MNHLNASGRKAARLLSAGLLVGSAGITFAATRYVDVNGINATPPYTNWAIAATNIQDAVDAAVAGDEIVVTNGIYASGGRTVSGTVTNRVTVDKRLTLRSVNGPVVTIIQGHQAPGGNIGEGAIRCVYLADGASLTGFTLTKGASLADGGGLWCETITTVMISNCVVAGNAAYQNGGGTRGGTFYNCTLSGNSAYTGGGASSCTLNNCTLIANSAYYGGGVDGCTLNNCALSTNSASYAAGGAGVSTLNNCILTGNSCSSTYGSGGGAESSTLNNCTLTGNSGGGASSCKLNNCIVYFNTAAPRANWAWVNYDLLSTLNNCCTTPQPTTGVGNISSDPQLASASHLSAGSACRGGGNAAYASGTDIDGETWLNPPSIGCDEYHAGALTGPLRAGISASFTNVATGFTVQLTGLITGRAAASSWDFGDGITISNQPYASHAWASPGDYAVILRAYNESQPAGISATLSVHVVAQPVHYVAADSGNPVAPYTSWATAATNIQDAVDAATVPGASVLVTNGIYATGGSGANRVGVYKPLTVRSVNGPQVTIIRGYQLPGATNGVGAIRCVYLADGASLTGFTLTNGATLADYSTFLTSAGGGLWCETMTTVVISNCVVAGNSAYLGGGGAYGGTFYNCTLSGNSTDSSGGGANGSVLYNCTLSGNSAGGIYGGSGGGASGSILNDCTLTANMGSGGGGAEWCTLNNCTLSGNSASLWGGGVFGGTLNNCTLSGNSAGLWGGGEYGCTMNNCVAYFNTAGQGSNYYNDVNNHGILNYCCTTPQPTNGVGNIILDPQLASASHLSAGSPCRGAGNAAYTSGTDIDGEAWLNPPSIGCDEYHPGAVAGPLSVGITASRTNVLIGFTVQFAGAIEGRTTTSSWDFGDGTTVTNQPYTAHAWSALGDYAVVLRAYNETQPGGINATAIVHVVNGVHYVAAESTNPIVPYASWATAATNIQDAINAVEPGGPVAVVVSNGNYAPVAASGPLTVRSVNGPLFTIINGGGSNLCATLTNGASLSGFTLTNGAGGVSGGTLTNCMLSGNASYGASSCALDNCTITGNSLGGASGCTLRNCALAGNFGIGAIFSTLTNCTLTGNSGGGASGCTLHNCILYFNTAAAQAANYDSSSTLDYCCASPQQTNGVGNISLDPQLASAWHLSAASPCRGAGSSAYASGADIDGEGWLSPPSIGCDEYHAGAVTGALSVSLTASFTNALVGFAVQFTASIGGRITASSWDFGDGTTATNQPYTSHAWTVPGDYAVVLRAYNETHPGGISATVVVHIGNGVHYVAADSGNPVTPYGSWATAATNIQEAINVVEGGGPLAVVVSNGNYTSVKLPAPLTVRSVNGPPFTIINGSQTNLCAVLTNGSSLSGFTLTNGVTGASGGALDNCTLIGNGYGAQGCTLNNCALTGNHSSGAYSCTLSNCTVAGNSGDGADYCTLNNCTVEGNSGYGAVVSGLNNCAVSANSGYGASQCTLTNCTLAGNSRYYGVGAASSILNNCLAYFNGGANYDSSCTLNYCCTTPQPTNGLGNISSDPQLVSLSHLSANSPCRGAGNASYVGGIDIDGEAWANPPAIGCDEYHAGGLTGPLSVAIIAPRNNVLIGYALQLTGLIEGRAAASSWDFGDGSTATNQPITSHAWGALGDYTVVLHAYNESYPAGLSASVTVHVVTGVHYVAAGSTNPVAPYTSWATAATGIQDAINAAEPGAAQVLVTNGTYGSIYIPAFMTVRSINGAQFTTISGSGGSRCATLSTNASLSGFTLLNGFASHYGGGAYGGTLNDCTLTGNVVEAPLTERYICIDYDPRYHFCRGSALGYAIGEAYGGGAAYCTLNNCTLTGNVVEAPVLYNPNQYYDFFSRSSIGDAYGGGAAFCTLSNCTLTGNLAQSEPIRDTAYDLIDNRGGYGEVAGGGVYNCTLTNCTLSNNRVQGQQGEIDLGDFNSIPFDVVGYGGGALDSTLNNCTLVSNWADGAVRCMLTNCVLTGNSGDGANRSTLVNTALTGNSGSGAVDSELNNCTLTGNSGQGASSSTLNNCIVYFNCVKNYDSSCTLNYCCTRPLPTDGVGNISADPQLASASHLSAGSPCRGAGNAAFTTGRDIDDEAWGIPPSIGCDEYHAGTVTGPLGVSITASFTNVAVGFVVHLTGLIEGRATASSWDFDDGSTATDEPYTSHAWSEPGDYRVVLRVFNDSYPGGVNATLTMHVVAEVHYVAPGSAGPAAPYTSWATAATNIQSAVDAAMVPGALVLVTNGTYPSISVTGLVNLRSVSGPLVTTIDGNLSNLCVSLPNGATLTGFTLTNGVGGASGGTLNNCAIVGNSGTGASACTLNNCIIRGNSAAYGGGASGATLNNCALTGNSATNAGGGAYSCTLNNCTLTGNSAGSYGGASGCALNNCIVYFNTAHQSPNYDPWSTLNYCCTTPQPTNGFGNIIVDPELASASHLSAGSPCRGAGNATYASGTDIDGEAWASPPSIGCDEYHAGAVSGALSVAISAQSTNVAVGFPLQLTGLIEGQTSDSVWDFGDGNIAMNKPFTAYEWDSPGDYLVALWAFNDTHPNGVRGTLTIHVITGVHYVAPDSVNPQAPYTSWATAATNIQDAIDAATEPGARVLVTNGTYASGWRAFSGTTNRLVIHAYLALQSANGPTNTTIDGGQAVRCVYLAGSSAISGFTLANGAVSGYGSGGGVFCESSSSVVSNCVLAGNTAAQGGGAYGGSLNNCALNDNSAAYSGGGANGSALINCMLSGNVASLSNSGSGGGAYYCTLTNCTLVANSSASGGGTYNSTLDSCILSNNSANGGGGAYYGTLNNCTLTGNFGPGPYGSSGGGAYSCTLSDCTLAGNTAISGGGAYSCNLNNCTLSGNTAPYYVSCVNADCFYLGNGGGAHSSTLNNCTLAANSAGSGGGAAYMCNLTNCTLTGNIGTYYAGGAASSTLDNCTLSGNQTSPSFNGSGGGASSCTLYNCTLTGNWTRGAGGAASGCTLNNCALNHNWAMGATGNGGGASGGTLNNCWLTGNWAALSGGGAYSSRLNNCTLTGNSVPYQYGPGPGGDSGSGGGGASSSTLNNCILYYNTALSGANYDVSTVLNYCCTTPLPGSGTNNIDAEPHLASASHLSASSPCISRGSGAFATGTDIDAEAWANPPSIGCDEYHAGGATGPLSVSISVPFTNITRGFTLGFTALIEGQTTASDWQFSDGVTVSNQPYTSRTWTSVGDYTVVLRAYNQSLPGGISATVMVHVITTPPVYYVAAESTNPVAPYTSWGTAAANIQDAVDAATVPGALVLVSNGIYAAEGRTVDGYTANRVAVNKPLSLRSVNGPQFTTVDGAHWGRCVYLTNGASLSGFTLTNGWPDVRDGGGGVYGGTVSNCVLTGNFADYGGGARDSILNDCALIGNSVNFAGGGAHGCALNRCTLAGNSGGNYNGGGADYCTLTNCLLATNSASAGGGACSSALDHCVLTGNSANYNGGGAYSCTLNGCMLTGNWAYGGGGASSCTLNNCSLTGNSSENGGGANSCTLNSCLLTGNSSDNSGGGAQSSTLNNCTLTGNSATGTYGGGGAYYSTLNNCIVYFNASTSGPNFDYSSFLNYCCTWPQPTFGLGNVTNAPRFVDTNGWASLRLQSNSPCINSGNNAYVTNTTDLDGNPRIAGGTVDIGAYEFQAPASTISYAWLQQYGLPTDGSADFTDPDRDGMNNWQEWRAGTNPTNSLSALRIISALPTGTNVTISWESVVGINYFLERSTNLFGVGPVFTPLALGITGQDGTTSFVDTNVVAQGPVFYRVGGGF
ncbi:MAG TPA: PKD domain-containing protein [Candidatus Limnocylindrales bacterium]|nr:PKD domain-containing protein [Candidatus Limnocylindrales bacterium]